MEKTKLHDFVELSYTGYHDGKPFDSNIVEDLKEINPEAKPEQTIVVIGEKMVLAGLDSALEGKELNKQYEIQVPYKDGFGPRKRELVKTIPLSVFREQKINPRPGMPLFMDNAVARVITVSGARVLTDFNNPLAGKDLEYKFTITKIINDDKEKSLALFKYYARETPEIEIKDKIIVKAPENFKPLIEALSEKFKTLIGKELAFELKEQKPEKVEPQNLSDKKEIASK